MKEINKDQLKKLLEGTGDVGNKRKQKKQIIDDIRNALPNHVVSVPDHFLLPYLYSGLI